MVHQRARNLPTKGIVIEWLFKNDTINFGEDFAKVRLDDGTDFVVKSNYNGVIVRTIKLNTPVKNGSILANIVVGDKEIVKYKNKVYLKNFAQQNTEEFMPEDFDKKSGQAQVDLNSEQESKVVFSDSVTSNQALSQVKEGSEMSGNVSHNRFAQMRANIKKSIENSPQYKEDKSLNNEELLKINNEDIIKTNGAEMLFKQDGVGPSKFRQLVNARKKALLEENNFKEVEDVAEFNAMSKTDEKGRPLIMRNIVAARMEKLNKAGGDVKVLENETNDSKIDMGGENKMAIENDMSGFAKIQNPRTVRNQEEEQLEVSTYKGTVLPGKDPDQLIGEIQNKTNKTYAESKLSNLYDAKRRNTIIAGGNERNIILQRKQAVEMGMENSLSSNNTVFWKGNLPKKFSNIVPLQSTTGNIEYVRYDSTPAGKRELEDWKISNNNAGKHQNNLVEHEPISDLDVTQEWDIQDETPKQIQKQLDNKIIEQEKKLKEVAGNAVANEAIDLLKQQIADLQITLEKQNQLNAATQRLNAAPTFGGNYAGGTDSFSQLFQYMMMQNIMQNMPTNKNSSSDVKDIIRYEIENFKRDISPWRQHQNYGFSPCGCYNSQMPQPMMPQPNCPHNFGQSYQQPVPHQNPPIQNNHQREHFTQMPDENFEKSNFVEQNSYLEFEGRDTNKIVQRKKVNKNRNAAVKSMILSQNYIPPLTISTEIDMSSILKLKYVLKKTQDDIKFPSIAFIAKAISITLDEYPSLNSSYDPETNEVVVKKYHNIGLATETSEGLIIPVLKFVEKLSIKEVAIDIKEMTTRLRSGKLYDYETEGSTITIANYGNVGAIQATPTIFYPNAAVIGVGKVVKKPVVVSDEKIAIKAIMNMTLTVDQRIIDAAEAGQFLAKIKDILERPELLTVS